MIPSTHSPRPARQRVSAAPDHAVPLSSPTQPQSLARTQAPTIALNALTSVLSETEGLGLRLRLSLVIRGGITLQQRRASGACVAYTTGRYSAPNLQRADLVPGRSLLAATPARSPQLAHAACPSNLLPSKSAPAFHTAKVIAAILRAIVTRASSGRSPRASISA